MLRIFSWAWTAKAIMPMAKSASERLRGDVMKITEKIE
jgi:hypothetical protein